MPAPVIAQLLITFGPAAIQLIQQLVAVWNKPTLTPDEVNAIIAPLVGKSADQYLAEAKGAQPS